MPPAALATDVIPLVVFSLHGQSHAIPAEGVQEVVRMVALQPIAAAPEWVAGMINLRGAPVVVVDLRRRLGYERADYGLATPIVIARTSSGAAVGLIADSIEQLVDLPREALFPAAAGGLTGGVARLGTRLVSVADVDAIAAGAEQLLVR